MNRARVNTTRWMIVFCIIAPFILQPNNKDISNQLIDSIDMIVFHHRRRLLLLLPLLFSFIFVVIFMFMFYLSLSFSLCHSFGDVVSRMKTLIWSLSLFRHRRLYFHVPFRLTQFTFSSWFGLVHFPVYCSDFNNKTKRTIPTEGIKREDEKSAHNVITCSKIHCVCVRVHCAVLNDNEK